MSDLGLIPERMQELLEHKLLAHSSPEKMADAICCIVFARGFRVVGLRAVQGDAVDIQGESIRMLTAELARVTEQRDKYLDEGGGLMIDKVALKAEIARVKAEVPCDVCALVMRNPDKVPCQTCKGTGKKYPEKK